MTADTAETDATPMPHLDGVEHRFLEARGIRFHVAEAGRENGGTPIVMIHGWPQHWYAWRHLIPLLATDHHVICPDLRGFGWSDAPPGPYDKPGLADDMSAVLDELGVERCHLVAHDWGALVGFMLCLSQPERFTAYLPINMVTPWPPKPSPRRLLGLWRIWYQVVIAAPLLGRLAVGRLGFPAQIITAGAAHPEAWTKEDVEAFAAPLREPARTRASVRLYRTFLTRELLPFLSGRFGRERLRVRTRMLFGLRDLAMTEDSLGRWREMADDMDLETVEDAGHFVPEERPDLVAARARELFAGA